MTTPDYADQNVFAKILRDELPCHKIYEDDNTLAFMDVMPRGDDHVLVGPQGRFAQPTFSTSPPPT